MIQRQRNHLNNVFLCVLVASIFVAWVDLPQAVAGTGSAISAPTNIDTQLPQITVVPLPANLFVLAAENFEFEWSLTEDNPSLQVDYNVAEVWIGDQLQSSSPFNPGTGAHTWLWTAPDTTSASVRLVVNSSDSFGNTTVLATTDFTILSSVTHVPEAARAAIFALPAPNPFNPMTKLAFDLPQSGLVTVTVHDARGYRVNTLFSGRQPAGPLALRWDGRDNSGRRQAGGTYFFRLEFPYQGRHEQIIHKAVLLP